MGLGETRRTARGYPRHSFALIPAGLKPTLACSFEPDKRSMRDAERSVPSRRLLSIIVASSIGIAFLAGTTSALAIPSPELIVGSFTSISQLIALASAVIGGGATIAAMRIRSANGGKTSRSLIGLLVATVVLLTGSVGFNIYQYVDQKNERQARLEDTLLRPSRMPGSLPLDPEVKELNYRQQTQHPMGMATDAADKLLAAAARGEADDVIFLDVRETAEREMGTLPGVRFVRYPDIPSANIDFTGKKAVLFCHNGNRSHEVCEALAKQGIDCRFIVGGLEKWVVENRSIDGLGARSLDQLRAIPPYRNQNTLLDTPDVRRLVGEEKAIFVDVRYPVEFAQQRLPSAINLAIRRLPTAELQRQIAGLPRHPIVLPCYDRRGCFFAEVLGLELTRAGHDVRGRYTQPWLYFVQAGRPPHVRQWIEENNRSIWVKTARHLADVLSSVSRYTGVILAILLLALLSRILVLPFSVKAERDQIRSRAASDELKALESRFEHDPVRRVRAIRAFYKRLGLTPVRNLVALLFLPIMAIALTAVQQLAATDGGRLPWASNLAERDPLLILPVLFGGLLSLYLDMAFVQSTKHRILVWGIAFPLLTATGALFSAGADVYLVASAALLLLQRVAVAGEFARLGAWWRRFRLGRDIISLDEPDRLAPHGNKAYRLARMRARGLPVPAGVLLTSRFLEQFASEPQEWRIRQLDRIWRWLSSASVVVRSSAMAEDSEQHSFAGVFESVLNIDRNGLEAAIGKVRASFDAGRVKSYVAGGGSGSILIQRMIAAEYAGVLFTRDPAAAGLAMAELVRGTAEGLVSGAVRPVTYRIGRVSGRAIGEGEPPVDLAMLQSLGRRTERLFGTPQDIEWTYHAGRFDLVQSRDITRTMEDASDVGLVRRDMARALDLADGMAPDEIAFAKNEFSEMMPRPTPLSLSLMEALWEAGGSVDLAARRLGLSYQIADDNPDYFVTILGRLYVNRREEQARVLNVGPLAARRLARNAERIEKNFRESVLPRFLGEIRLTETADFDKLSTAELCDEIVRIRDRFALIHVEVDVVNIATNFYLERARHQLSVRGLDPSGYLGHIPETYESYVLAEMEAAPAENRRSMLLAKMGHRAVLDYELSEPRYAENPSALDRMSEFHSAGSLQRGEVERAERNLGRALTKSVEIARRFQALKEDAKHHSLRQLAVMRQAILALDRRLGLGGRSFFLTFDELVGLRERPELRDVAAKRQQERARLIEMAPLAPSLTVADLEAMSAGGDAADHDNSGFIRGTRVSGTGTVEGRARVVADAVRSAATRSRPSRTATSSSPR
jgi:rhodanese-related sulfurtransferase/membrane protein insertase Oxa1/YidC/SpoIIIJ